MCTHTHLRFHCAYSYVLTGVHLTQLCTGHTLRSTLEASKAVTYKVNTHSQVDTPTSHFFFSCICLLLTPTLIIIIIIIIIIITTIIILIIIRLAGNQRKVNSKNSLSATHPQAP